MAADTIRIEIPIETIDHTEPGISNVTRRLERVGSAANQAGASAENAGRSVSRFDRSSERTQRSLAKWAREKYEILLAAKDKVSPVLTALKKSGIRGIAGRTWSVTVKAFDLVTSPVRGILNLLRNPIFQAGAVLGVSIGLADTVNTYKDFEAAMSQVEAISGATASDMEKLNQKAKEMGATTKFTAKESADAFQYMAMAGWGTEDMLGGIEGILNLAAASGTELATTSDIVTDALTAFGMKASEAGHFADVLAAASSKSNTNVSLMGETFKYAGSMAGTLGYSIEDIALATGLMANAGIKGNMAGTALNSIFTRLSTNTNGAADALEELGIAYFNTDGSARDFADVLGELRDATAGYTDKQKANLANTVAGTYAQKGFLAMLNATTEDYGKLSEAVENADGAAQSMAETMLDNLQGSITIFQSALDGVKLSLGERFAPYIRSAADWLTEMMPSVETALNELMDFADRKIERLQEKFREISGTDEWQNADIFGKVKIAWREIIADPFSEWWEREGRYMIGEKASEIGNAIGSGLSSALLTLLGIDVSDTVEEGASIGKAFASGFAKGFDFDQISSKLWDGIKNLFSNASKLLPGGEAADFSSLMSAALLAKIASPLFGLGGGAIRMGKALFGAPAEGGASMMGSLIGSAGAGTGLLGFGANTAIRLGAGNLAGGASLGAGTMGALGLGAVAGGVAGGASVISGGLDLYKAVKSENQEESSAYAESGAWKVGGTMTGALAGAAIGSAIPVLGTAVGALLGAGIGGISGWIKGNQVKEEYEANLEVAQEAAAKAQKVLAATGFSLEEVSFETDALNDAIEDTEVSAEQLGAMFQEAVSDKLKSKFGDLHLSLKEIKDTASSIVFDKQIESINVFTAASQDSSNALISLQNHQMTLDKMNWEVNLGMELDSDAIEEYKSAVNALAAQAKNYLKEKHFEATAAVELLTGDGKGNTSGLDLMYEGLQKQVDEVNAELQRVMSDALSDGVVSKTDQVTFQLGGVSFEMDEASAIAELQGKIAEITDQVSKAQEEAGFAALKIRYGGGALDVESFTSLQEELAANVQNMNESYDNALEVSLTNLNLQKSEGAIDEDQYAAEVQKLNDSYSAQIDELQIRVGAFQLEAIAENFSRELDGILPDLEGTTSEKLMEAMDRALAIEPNAAAWTTEDISRWFGLESLSTETQDAIGQLLQKTAETIPQKMMEAVASAELQAEDLVEKLNIQLMGGVVLEGFSDYFSNSDYSLSGYKIADGVGNAIGTADMSGINAGIDTLYGNTGAQIDATFAKSFTTAANVMVELNWELMNPTADININGGGSTKVSANVQTANVQKHASGGFVTGKQLSWLAEEGYGEFVIPTNPSRRSRALELYEQAGVVLGVAAHSDGGYVGGSVSRASAVEYTSANNKNENVPWTYSGDMEGNYDGGMVPAYSAVSTGMEQSAERAPVQVNVSVSPEFVINSSNEQSEDGIIEAIKRHMKEIADELGGEIAVNLMEVYSNMPRKGVQA